MQEKMKKHIEKSVILILVTFIIIGLFLNHKLKDNFKTNTEVEKLLTEEEREYFSSEFEVENRDSDEFSKKYLKILEEIKLKDEYLGKEEDIAKLYYVLGFNAYLNKDIDHAVKYLGLSMDKFENIPNYFYKLNGNNILMNIAYRKNDYVEGINRANKIYEILQTPNIKGISKQGQNGIKTNTLNGLVNISSKLGMTNMAKTYYDELVEITELDKNLESNISIYAKYIYNFMIKDYTKAKKYAQEYINYHIELDPKNIEKINESYIYLLEILIELKDFEGSKLVFDKVASTKAAQEGLIKAILLKFKGTIYEKNEMYEESFFSYKESLNLFEELEDYENSTYINNKIIELADDMKLDIEPYIENLEKYKKIYDKDSIMGEIVDSLTKTTHQKNAEEKAEINEKLERNSKLTNMSKQINFIYLAIIILLIFMAKKLKGEVLIRKSKEQELEKMVRTDYLTKAYSKQFIFDKTKLYITEQKKFTFIIFDLDNFKKINDNFGHAFGDYVLVEIIKTVKQTLGNNGYVGRFGGEEFVIILKENMEASKFIENMRCDIANIKYNKENFVVTVSGGAIRWNGQKCDEIVYDADVLLYKAKTGGKDRILLR
ncbi:MAG: tetratricopeptide repeat-containing diguanylate cyclase [Sarcina sp.]